MGRLRWLNQRVRRAGGRVPAGVLLEWDRTESWGTSHESTHQPRCVCSNEDTLDSLDTLQWPGGSCWLTITIVISPPCSDFAED